MAGANRIHGPGRGTLQFWPRVRARKIVPRVRTWPSNPKTIKIQGFIGYKVGMTHIMMRDNRPASNTKGEEIAMPATVLECPPMKVSSLRFYKKTSDGLKLIHDTSSKKSQVPKEFSELRLVAFTQPKFAGFGKKDPDYLEIAISGSNNEEKLKLANELLTKEIKVTDVFKDGQYLDTHGVTTGKRLPGNSEKIRCSFEASQV